MTNEVEEIKSRVEVVDLIKSYIQLIPAGKNYKALCPFHGERSPSFFVSPERKTWHCFGRCAEGGDVIKFVMKYENMEFREALRFLAERAGITLRTMNPREEKEFGILYELHDAAKQFFKTELTKNPAAQIYLKSRGLEQKTIEEFEVGYAPGGESLALHLLKLKHDIADIVRSGLAQKNVRGLYRDRFDSRIIFPIASHVGKTVAFTGRILPEVEKHLKAQGIDLAKYLNSPETPIFNKSKILYGFNKSKQAIAESRSVFIVEGQMDCLMAYQAGIKNVVAVSGTGLTSQHLERLEKVADTVLFSFDNDSAGLAALERGLDTVSGFDFHVKAVNLGEFKDPAEAVEKDPEFLKKAVAKALPAMEHLLNHHFGSGEVMTIVGKKKAIRDLLGKVKKMKSAIERDVWIKEIARRTRVSETAIEAELLALGTTSEAKGDDREEAILKALDRMSLISERLVLLSFTNSDFFAIVKANIDWLPEAYQRILLREKREGDVLLEMRAEYEYGDRDPKLMIAEIEELIGQLQIEHLKRKRESLKNEIKNAEHGEHETELKTIMLEFQEVTKKVIELEEKLLKMKSLL